MGPITYALCKKPVIGLVLFVSSACAFPPLFHNEPFPLQVAGAHLIKEFEAPVTKSYSLALDFAFPTAAATRADEVVGDRYDESCVRDYATISLAQRRGLGRPIPIHVLVREKETGTISTDAIFHTLCITSHGGPGFVKTRTAARLKLVAGTKYIIELRSLEDQAGLDGVKTTVSLYSGERK